MGESIYSPLGCFAWLFPTLGAPNRAPLKRDGEHHSRTRVYLCALTEALQEVLEGSGSVGTHFQDVVLRAGHAVAVLDFRESLDPIRKIVRLLRVKRTHRHQRSDMESDRVRIDVGSIRADDSALLEFAHAVVDRRRRKTDPTGDIGVGGPCILLKSGKDLEVPLIKHPNIIESPGAAAVQTEPSAGIGPSDVRDWAGGWHISPRWPIALPRQLEDTRATQADPLRLQPKGTLVTDQIFAPTFFSRTNARGVRRVFTILDESSSTGYRRAVARVQPAVRAAVGKHALGSHAPGHHGLATKALAERKLTITSHTNSAVAVTDVQAFFVSITPQIAERSMSRIGVSRKDRLGLRRILERFQDLGVTGLPIGPVASAIVADAVLSPVDQLLADTPYVRWVDDIAVGGRDPAGTVRRVTEVLSSLGLRHHPEKTRTMSVSEFHQSWVQPLSYHRLDAHPL